MEYFWTRGNSQSPVMRLVSLWKVMLFFKQFSVHAGLSLGGS